MTPIEQNIVSNMVEWTRTNRWNENGMRTDAEILFQVGGITEGNTMDIFGVLNIKSLDQITEEVMIEYIHGIAWRGVSVRHYEWWLQEITNDDGKTDYLIIGSANASITDDPEDEIDETSGQKENA